MPRLNRDTVVAAAAELVRSSPVGSCKRIDIGWLEVDEDAPCPLADRLGVTGKVLTKWFMYDSANMATTCRMMYDLCRLPPIGTPVIITASPRPFLTAAFRIDPVDP